MAVVEEMNIDGAIVRFHDDYICGREESEKILQKVADGMLRQLNAQYNAEKYQERKQINKR